jgi:TPR repeat protein
VPTIPIAVISNPFSSKPAPPADGDERTPEQIFAYYKDRADQGHARSQYNVGVCYERGQGVERSERMAFQYYLRSSKQGFAFAEFSLGQCYLKGFGVGVNESKAIELFKKAAAQKLERAIEALRGLNVK